ncbi:MAG: hypothetical protein ABIJ00_05380 [Candidatus Eisenbacteria bacterium]
MKICPVSLKMVVLLTMMIGLNRLSVIMSDGMGAKCQLGTLALFSKMNMDIGVHLANKNMNDQ